MEKSQPSIGKASVVQLVIALHIAGLRKIFVLDKIFHRDVFLVWP